MAGFIATKLKFMAGTVKLAGRAQLVSPTSSKVDDT